MTTEEWLARELAKAPGISAAQLRATAARLKRIREEARETDTAVTDAA